MAGIHQHHGKQHAIVADGAIWLLPLPVVTGISFDFNKMSKFFVDESTW
jgi:hypothetical protein